MGMNAVIDLDERKTEQPAALHGRDILCFSHDWTGDPLSKTHLMRLLSRHNRVLWVNSIGYRTPSVVSKADMSRVLKKLLFDGGADTRARTELFVLNPVAVPFTTGLARQSIFSFFAFRFVAR